MQDLVQWTSPSPFWTQAAAATDLPTRRSFLQHPAILRFATDAFMEEFLAALETDPARLRDLQAAPETWRGPSAAPPPLTQPPAFARTLHRLGLAVRRKAGSASALTPNAVATAATITSAAPPMLKLYQPAHQRYYLVTACLVCGRAGLPDRGLNPARQERVSFVIRRLMPPGGVNIKAALPTFDPHTWEEHAFVASPHGNGWQRIAQTTPTAGNVLVPGEEQLPLFAVHFHESDGRRRRLFAGLVPVGKREAYMGAPARMQPDDPPPVITSQPPPDPRMMLVWTTITEPWKRLLEQAQAARAMQNAPAPGAPPSNDAAMPASAKNASVKATREQLQTVSWYVLLDFVKFLEEHMASVWRALRGQTPQPPLTPEQTTLVTALTNTSLSEALTSSLVNSVYDNTRIARTLKDALAAIRGGNAALDARTAADIEEGLEQAAHSYDREPQAPATLDPHWPRFLFPLADCVETGPLPPASAGDDPNRLEDQLQRLDHLADLIKAALPAQPTGATPANPIAALPVKDPREGWFVLRCVFERPMCGPLDPPLVSEPTPPFQMAGFFDPDAPARPVRIALPVDTSPAGLRKFDKNTAFMISDILCGQIDRVKALSLGDLVRSVLPWPLHKDLSAPDKGPCTTPGDPSLQAGMICSFSLPIITICALLLLIIIVNLLNIIFRWLPYFFICFPLPGFKAKK
jgi:hypothetical protein